MIAFRCLACHSDWILSESTGAIRCHCGRSSATFDDGVVELLGPCAATRLGDGLDSVDVGLTTIRRKPVPPLL